MRYLVTIFTLLLPLQFGYLTLLYEQGVNTRVIKLQTASDIQNMFDYTEWGKISKIVLDAGHGGKDHGCTANHQREKEIALGITLRLGELIERNHPKIEVVYTRKSDVFIPLYKRIRIANKENADLFISIHCNYSEFPNVKGSESYVMGLHSAKENLNVAKRENASVLMEADFEKNYDGYDPNSPAGHIILSMYQNAFLEQSINMAQKIEYEFNVEKEIKSRGVKQAGFVVLKKATMPSVLIETGYLSNVEDAKRLSTDKGQKQVAIQIYRAFENYKREVEIIRADGIVYTPETTKPVKVQPKETFKSLDSEELKTQNHLPKVVFSKQYRDDSVKPQKSTPSVNPQKTKVKSHINHNLRYRVQIAASKGKPLQKNGMKWRNLQNLDMTIEDGMYKYLVGMYPTLERALEVQSEMRALGFNGAFVVAYDGDMRIGLKKAREITSKKNNF